MKYTTSQIATLIGARRYGERDYNVAFLLTDSRSLSFAEETMFFALRSKRNDGHRYIQELYKRGVRNFVVDTTPSDSSYEDANFLVVPDTLAALQRLAERHRDEFQIPVIGITGSNGKTVVKEWLYQLLAPSMNVTRSPRSYNSQIGVPLSVWNLREDTEVGIFEAGISQPDEMRQLADIIQPTIGVFTTLGEAHQENFHSLEDKCREKFQLFKDCKTLIYPIDNDVVFRIMRQCGFKGEMLGWSASDPSAAFYVTSTDKKDDHTTIHYIYKGTESEYTINYISAASVENSITCAVTALHIGLSPAQLAERMQNLEPVAMRLEVKVGKDDCILINDSYNSDLASLDIALDFMHRRPDHKERKHTLILSDIDQSGLPTNELCRRVADMARSRGISKLITIGTQLNSIADCHFATTDEFIASNEFANLRNEVILIKGARRFSFDKITELLVEKVHETTLEVNLSAVVANLNWYRSQMKPGTKLVCMIKADGYGAGAIEIAKTLQDHRVDYLAVAVADEGVALRQAGITANIMIMNPEMTAFKTMFDYDLEPEVYSFRLLDALRHAARKEGITDWPVHIKLDTGMHRLGFHPIDDMPKLIDYLKNQNALTPRSVFSHFVGSDGDEFDEFSKEQFELYTQGADALQSAFQHHIIRHMCNSAGIEHFPERQMDMCRLGLGLYGINPRNNKIINNVSTLKTTILQLRNVKAGDSIGYSRRTILDKDSLIAAIPIGYADGLNRHLGNRHGYCLVNGKKAEYVGNICMDVCMIDVTGIDCHEGDSVEIFGDNLPVTVLSDILDTIPYEVMTGISNRVKRVYYEE
ncbi:MAG: bifunctional UDP-N-acetylmuramoyl-tripeptide:D-alanyl-D-alanine ligase/alanine racemase [Prevotella sp.]|nr:bifunctional UDP-N-acetylmuramoyl-tripeptide:D-alanyl-D-alanine ligase/alanine racemase [Prevotella sp.]